MDENRRHIPAYIYALVEERPLIRLDAERCAEIEAVFAEVRWRRNQNRLANMFANRMARYASSETPPFMSYAVRNDAYARRDTR